MAKKKTQKKVQGIPEISKTLLELNKMQLVLLRKLDRLAGKGKKITL